MKSYVIGLDIGTSAVKAVLFQRSGHVVVEHEITYPTSRPHIGWAEQDPLEIERATKKVLKEVVERGKVDSRNIAGIGLSSAMHSLICIDEHNEPLSPLITWADQRSARQAARLQEQKPAIYNKTGTPLHPMTPFTKLVWMKETGYEPYRRASKFLSFKEFLLTRWLNANVVDYATAAAAGLFNKTMFKWEEEALDEAGISKEQLSTPVPPTYVCQGLPPALAQELGVRSDLPFVVGASDGPLANIGLGAMSSGDVTITIGTSGAIRQMSDTPRTDDKQEIFCYTVSEQLWVMGGPTNNGGSVLHWMKHVLGEEQIRSEKNGGLSAFEQLTELASTSPAGANGLLFLPYLDGERAPLWDAHARGAYIGLTASHTKADMIRAGLEGTLFNIYHIGKALERLAGEPNNLLASGGFSRSRLWLQILADLFGKNIRLPLNYQSSAWAAAWFTLMATGEEKRLEDIKGSIPMREMIEPNELAHKKYRNLFPIYEEASAKLRTTFRKLSAYQREH